MRVLGMTGFENENPDADGVVVIAFTTGGPFLAAETDPLLLPPGASNACLAFASDECFRPWAEGNYATASRRQAAGTRWMFQFQARCQFTDREIRYGVALNGAPVLTLSRGASGALGIHLNGGAVEAVSSYVWPAGGWTRLTVDVDNQIGGYVRVYADGDLENPILDHTLSAALPNPDGFYWVGKQGSFSYIDDAVACEFGVGVLTDALAEVIDATIGRSVPDAAGNYTDWTGAFGDIDEIPFDDADSITAGAVDEVSTFEHSGIVADRVLAAQVCMRMQRAGSSAGTRVQIRQRLATTDADAPSSAVGAPGDGHVGVILDADANGSVWSTTTFNASEFGPVSRT